MGIAADQMVQVKVSGDGAMARKLPILVEHLLMVEAVERLGGQSQGGARVAKSLLRRAEELRFSRGHAPLAVKERVARVKRLAGLQHGDLDRSRWRPIVESFVPPKVKERLGQQCGKLIGRTCPRIPARPRPECQTLGLPQ